MHCLSWAPQKSKQAAVDWEHRFLSQFDYAWNRRCNAAARHVVLRRVRLPSGNPFRAYRADATLESYSWCCQGFRT